MNVNLSGQLDSRARFIDAFLDNIYLRKVFSKKIPTQIS